LIRSRIKYCSYVVFRRFVEEHVQPSIQVLHCDPVIDKLALQVCAKVCDSVVRMCLDFLCLMIWPLVTSPFTFKQVVVGF